MNGDWQVVDHTGHVYMRGLTRDDANGAMVKLLEMKSSLQLHTEREGIRKTAETVPPPAVAPAPAIEPEGGRDALRAAIEERLDALARLESANQAVERARAFVDARQTELDAMQAAHADEIRNAGANLAETFRSGSALEANRVIDRSALLDAETRLATAQAAFSQLEAERIAAEGNHQTAEARVRLAVLSIKRAECDVMVDRLEAVRAEYMRLATAIEGARFSDVPTTPRALLAMRIGEPSGTDVTEATGRWYRFGAALTEDHEAVFGEV